MRWLRARCFRLPRSAIICVDPFLVWGAQVKFLSKSTGSVKYKTNCAPKNGYYLVPLYDKVCTYMLWYV